VSGIAASATHDGVLWVHNDSGDEARFYAVDDDGRTVATVGLRGARAVDWEDMAAAGGHLFAGDIGDNRERREGVQIYRVREPALEDRAVASERMTLTYPDGAHDAEALLVHPTTGEIGIITKENDDPALYVTPGFTAGAVTLDRAASVPVALATGAAVAPDASSIVVRDYTQGYLFELDGPRLASAFDEAPQAVDMPFAIQAEAITFSADGNSLLTTHEGTGATVFQVPVPEEEPPEAEPPVPDPPAERPGTSLWPVAVASAAALVLAVVAIRLRKRPA
jgi:hypothetical protein